MERDQLQSADIILTSRPFRDSMISAVIKAGTLSSYSHAMMYVGNNYVIEAIGEGVTRRGLSLALNGCDKATVFRHATATAEQRQYMAAFVTWQVGGQYASPGVATGSGVLMTGLLPLGLAFSAVRSAANASMELFGRQRSYYCSELVADAYRSAGLPLGIYGRTPSLMNPGDIAEYSDRNPQVLVNLGDMT